MFLRCIAVCFRSLYRATWSTGICKRTIRIVWWFFHRTDFTCLRCRWFELLIFQHVVVVASSFSSSSSSFSSFRSSSASNSWLLHTWILSLTIYATWLARWLCARILLHFLFQLVLVSAAGGTSRRNSAVLIVQVDSLEKRIFEGTCDMDAGKDQDSSVPTVRCIRKRFRTCIDTLGPSIEECVSFSSTSLPTDSFMRERINSTSRWDAEEVLCARNNPVEWTKMEFRGIVSKSRDD